MSCDRFVEMREQDSSRAPEYLAHLAECGPCRVRDHELERLEALSLRLGGDEVSNESPTRMRSEELYRRILKELPEVAARKEGRAGVHVLAAAAILLVVCFGLLGISDSPRGNQLLSRVEASSLERDIIVAERRLRRLETSLRRSAPGTPRLSTASFRAHADFLDANIGRCREASLNNPANRAVNRALLRSLRRKASIVDQILTLSRPGGL